MRKSKKLQATQQVVSAVLYGIAISSLASVVLTKKESIHHVVETFQKCLSLANESLSDTFWYCAGLIVFLHLYFHDECLPRDEKLMKEPIFTVITGWMMFVFQILLLVVSVPASALLGILGVFVISFGVLMCSGESGYACWIVCENIVWCLGLCGTLISNHAVPWIVSCVIVVVVSHVVRIVIMTRKRSR